MAHMGGSISTLWYIRYVGWKSVCLENYTSVHLATHGNTSKLDNCAEKADLIKPTESSVLFTFSQYMNHSDRKAVHNYTNGSSGHDAHTRALPSRPHAFPRALSMATGIQLNRTEPQETRHSCALFDQPYTLWIYVGNGSLLWPSWSIPKHTWPTSNVFTHTIWSLSIAFQWAGIQDISMVLFLSYVLFIWNKPIYLQNK